MKEEVWKPIEGYEGIYEISNHGRVKSLSRVIKRRCGDYVSKEKIMKQTKTTTGYWKVELKANNVRKSLKVHRLVLLAFVGPEPESNERIVCNHKDGNPLNNCVDNLEWCTQRENILHAIKIGARQIYKIKKEKLREMYYDKKMTVKEIAESEKTTRAIITKRMRLYGFKGRGPDVFQNKYGLTVERVKGLVEMGFSITKIAKLYGCTQSNVSHFKSKSIIEGSWKL